MKSVLGFLLLTGAVAFGQSQSVTFSGTSTSTAAVGRISSGTATFGVGRFASPAVQGAPYSGEEVQERQQTLSDGTHINQVQSRRMMYRDSQGRTRIERTMFPGPNGQETPIVIEITDPINAVQYTLDTQNKIAHRSALQPMPTPRRGGVGGGGVLSAVPSIAPAPPAVMTATGSTSTIQAVGRGGQNGVARTFTTEKLGTQTFDGVMAEGQRQTMTIPAGAQGNDRDFNVITETWNAPDLRIAVYRKTSDPRSGESITKFNNLSRNEPDPQLFQVPGDYQVVDETGPFTVHYGQ